MNWQQLIDQFTKIDGSDVMLFAPPRDMEQAINTYNRAIFNLHHDSMDIALIALRKLAATYPLFAHASLLLGCCQAQLGHFDEARENIGHALLAELPDSLQEKALLAQNELNLQDQQEIPAANENLTGRPANDRTGPDSPSVPPAAVLEKSRRHGKVRMASEKERQSVLRRGEFPEEEETHVAVSREPVEYLRIAVPVLLTALAVGLLVFAGVRWIPGLVQQNRERLKAEERLTWLVERLDKLALQDQSVDRLLDDYQSAFDPAPAPMETTATTAETSGQTSAAATTAVSQPTTVQPTDTTATTVDPQKTALFQADQLYEQALASRQTDLMATARSLLEARALLTGLPAGTTAPETERDAEELNALVENLISSIGPDAAEKFRVPGMAEFDKQNYQEALEYFLSAYQLYPNAYGGGVAYYCGRCLQLLGDKAAAKPYFDYVVKTFPSRSIAQSAAARLREMGY